MSQKQPSKIARIVLLSTLGLSTACAPLHTVSVASFLPKSITGARRAECTPEPLGEPTLTVVRARVDVRRRVRPIDGSAPLDPRVVILAREMRRPAKLEPGTIIEVVYRVFDTPRTTCRATAPTGAHAAADASTREIVAITVGTGAAARRAFHVEGSGEGTDGFYASNGRPLEKAFLRYPVEFMLVTSGFSYGRRHPVLKKWKAHLGVDFAAPRGTPIVAVADGEVIGAGWVPYHGRRVSIRHADGSVSGYSHLERIAAAASVGARVRKGEVIGTVGTSGITTGPHVHFSLARRGKPVNPLGVQAPSLPQLTGAALAHLRASVAEAEIALAAAAPESTKPIQLARGAARK
jgi:murein DD-endopeptidase MepM/ murein hydrolase activator NlpD